MFNMTKANRTLVGGLAVALASLPAAAQASPLANTPGSPPVVRAMSVSPDRTPAHAGAGFQWDDAGIGAAGAAVLLGTGLALTGGTRRRRIHRPIVD